MKRENPYSNEDYVSFINRKNAAAVFNATQYAGVSRVIDDCRSGSTLQKGSLLLAKELTGIFDRAREFSVLPQNVAEINLLSLERRAEVVLARLKRPDPDFS